VGNLSDLGRVFVWAGLALLVVGGILLLGGKIPGLGRLPGDIVYRKGNVTFYFPLVTSLLISLVLTILLSLSRR
jgi:hypothetical protein